jgi:hypothetical protein
MNEPKINLIHTRITNTEKEKMIIKSKKLGFKNLSEYLRFVGLNVEIKLEIEK